MFVISFPSPNVMLVAQLRYPPGILTVLEEAGFEGVCCGQISFMMSKAGLVWAAGLGIFAIVRLRDSFVGLILRNSGSS
jgi:hypothetical protein